MYKCTFDQKAIGPKRFARDYLKRVFQSSARSLSQKNMTFQQIRHIRRTLPKGLLAHLVFMPNRYLFFEMLVR